MEISGIIKFVGGCSEPPIITTETFFGKRFVQIINDKVHVFFENDDRSLSCDLKEERISWLEKQAMLSTSEVIFLREMLEKQGDNKND